MDGIGSKVRKIGTAMNTIMDNQNVYRMRGDEINILVILPKVSSYAARIRHHMMRHWEKNESEATEECPVAVRTGTKVPHSAVIEDVKAAA